MPAPTNPNVICTPFVGRTIKGWSVRVRICFSVTPAEYAASTYLADVQDSLNSMETLISNLSNVSYVPIGGARLEQFNAYGSSGNYDEAEDSAVFSFATSIGGMAKVSIPAPRSSIFLGDNQTVDPSNTAVAAFVTALLSGSPDGLVSGIYGASKSGAVYSVFLGALRVRHRTRRKLNIFVREPSGTGTTPSIPGI